MEETIAEIIQEVSKFLKEMMALQLEEESADKEVNDESNKSCTVDGNFFYSSITHFNRKVMVTRHYIFWCAWESTSKSLLQSQLDIGILI